MSHKKTTNFVHKSLSINTAAWYILSRNRFTHSNLRNWGYFFRLNVFFSKYLYWLGRGTSSNLLQAKNVWSRDQIKLTSEFMQLSKQGYFLLYQAPVAINQIFTLVFLSFTISEGIPLFHQILEKIRSDISDWFFETKYKIKIPSFIKIRICASSRNSTFVINRMFIP